MKKPKYKDIKTLENGRKIYIYDKPAIEKRFSKKDKKLKSIKYTIPEILTQVAEDIRTGSEPALVAGLILCTYERVGNEESADRGHYGASNLEKRHIKQQGSTLKLDYIAKSGVKQSKTISDPIVVGGILFRIKNKQPHDKIFSCTPRQVNEYLDQFGITSKDIRTFAANKFMSDALRREPKYDRPSDRRRLFAEKLQEVAKVIGHKPQTLSSMYLTPNLKKNYVESGRIKRFTGRSK